MTEIVSIFNQRSVIWREIKGEIKAKEPERKEQKQSAENWDMKPVRLLARSAGAAPAAFCRSCVRLEAACRPPPTPPCTGPPISLQAAALTPTSAAATAAAPSAAPSAQGHVHVHVLLLWFN